MIQSVGNPEVRIITTDTQEFMLWIKRYVRLNRIIMGAFAPKILPPLKKKNLKGGQFLIQVGYWIAPQGQVPLQGLYIGGKHSTITNYFKNKGVYERGVYSAQQALCMEATNCILKQTIIAYHLNYLLSGILGDQTMDDIF